MRILYHHRTLGDGAEGVHIAAIVDALRSLGHDVRVMGAGTGGSGSPHRSIVTRVRAAVPRVVFEAASVALNLAEYAKAAREIRRFEPQLIYKRHARFDIGTLMAARAYRTPSVLEVNCLFSQPPYVTFEPISLRSLAAAFDRWALRLATLPVAVSSPLASMARALSSRQVEVVPNGADLRLFDPQRADRQRVRRALRLDDRPIIGWVGVLRDWHGLDLLIDVLSDIPDVYLLIVGDGPERRALEDAIAARGLTSRVAITGRVPHAEMPDYVAAMDIAVVAGERTGVASPMKLLEYMAMGRAVAAPALDNIRDVVQDGVTGLLFSAGDRRDLLGVLTRLVADGSLRLRLGTMARHSVQSERAWPQIASQILSLVESRDTGRSGARVTAR